MRPRSACTIRSSLIRVYTVCLSICTFYQLYFKNVMAKIVEIDQSLLQKFYTTLQVFRDKGGVGWVGVCVCLWGGGMLDIWGGGRAGTFRRGFM